MDLRGVFSSVEKVLEDSLYRPAIRSTVAFSAAIQGKFWSKSCKEFFLGEECKTEEHSWKWRATLMAEAFLYAMPLLAVEASLLYGALFATASLVRAISFVVFSFLGLIFFEKLGEVLDKAEGKEVELSAMRRHLEENGRRIESFLESAFSQPLGNEISFILVRERVLKAYFASFGTELNLSYLLREQGNFLETGFCELLENFLREDLFKGLKKLDISNLSLTKIPDTSSLSSLEQINFGENLLKKWPHNIRSDVRVTLTYHNQQGHPFDFEEIFPQEIPENVIIFSPFSISIVPILQTGILSFSAEEDSPLHSKYTNLFLSSVPKEKRASFLEVFLGFTCEFQNGPREQVLAALKIHYEALLSIMDNEGQKKYLLGEKLEEELSLLESLSKEEKFVIDFFRERLSPKKLSD